MMKEEGGRMADNRLDMALIQKSPEDGLTKNEISSLLDRLELKQDEQVDMVILPGEHAFAMGFIRMESLETKLGCDLSVNSPVGKAVIEVLDDMEKENPDSFYTFGNVKTYLGY